MTDEDRIKRGHRAASELRLTEEAFAAIKADLMERMLACSDQPSIMQFHAAINTVDKVQHALKLVVADGNTVSAIAEAGLARN